MTFDHTFRIGAPPNMVWAFLKDVPTVLEHIPGARFSGTAGATHSASFTIQGGPARSTYDLNVNVESLDETTHTAVIGISADDAAGRGGLRATLRVAVQPGLGGSNIALHADVDESSLTAPGAAAAFQGNAMPQVFASTANAFAANLERALQR